MDYTGLSNPIQFLVLIQVVRCCPILRLPFNVLQPNLVDRGYVWYHRSTANLLNKFLANGAERHGVGYATSVYFPIENIFTVMKTHLNVDRLVDNGAEVCAILLPDLIFLSFSFLF